MAMAATYDELEEMLLSKDGPQYELVGGELVERTVGDESTETASWIIAALVAYVRPLNLGRVFTSELGIRIFEDETETRRADVSFLSAARSRLRGYGYLRTPPELVVEVVSPSDKAAKLREKVDLWLRSGVRIVWVAYPDEHEIHVYRASGGASILTATDQVTGEDVIPGFASTVRELFPD
ncbi:MAG: Uma2 family endonuclease [Dehalococcoidia bacterium]|nr:Uma2 family endonuclease [Dehalococcoidia bacterium]